MIKAIVFEGTGGDWRSLLANNDRLYTLYMASIYRNSSTRFFTLDNWRKLQTKFTKNKRSVPSNAAAIDSDAAVRMQFGCSSP